MTIPSRTAMPYLLTEFYYRTQTEQTYADLARAVLVLPSGWRNEAFRGLTKCQAVPSEGSVVLYTTEVRKRSTRASCLNSRLSSC